MEGLAERTRRFADVGDMCAFYEALMDQWTLASDQRPSMLFGWMYPADKEAIFQHRSEHDVGLFRDQRTVQSQDSQSG